MKNTNVRKKQEKTESNHIIDDKIFVLCIVFLFLFLFRSYSVRVRIQYTNATKDN
jgi:hypothetical protein